MVDGEEQFVSQDARGYDPPPPPPIVDNSTRLPILGAVHVDEEQKVLGFEGRISRSEFWIRMAAVFGLFIAMGLIEGALYMMSGNLNAATGSGSILGTAAALVSLVVMLFLSVFAIWLSLATQVKRWHDLNQSGWMVCLSLIPFVGPVCFLVQGIAKGTSGINRYGVDPLESKESRYTNQQRGMGPAPVPHATGEPTPPFPPAGAQAYDSRVLLPQRRPIWPWVAVACAIVFIALPVVMALAVPQVLRMRKNANQTSAVQTLRTIASAEMSYNASYPAIGYGCPIATLGGDPKAGSPAAESAQLIDSMLATTGSKSGYVFTVTCGSKSGGGSSGVYNSVTITAVPLTVGRTGDNGYCTDESNVIKVDPSGGTNCTQQLE